MIEKLMNLNHFTYMRPFSGSDKNRQFRYIIRMVVREVEPEVKELFEGSREEISESMNTEPIKVKMLRAICWWGEGNSKVTPDNEKKVREFEFSEEGYDEVIKWLNEESDKIDHMPL